MILKEEAISLDITDQLKNLLSFKRHVCSQHKSDRMKHVIEVGGLYGKVGSLVLINR